jgi:hypothetical protein
LILRLRHNWTVAPENSGRVQNQQDNGEVV